MLILPPDHAQTLGRPYPFRVREKVILSGVMTIVAALAVVLVLSLVSGENHSRRGCISVGLAYSTGGETINRCGEVARSMCAGANQRGGITGASGRALATECRKAGLPVG